jgi:tetratricopeptide (TPR) repeat protein
VTDRASTDASETLELLSARLTEQPDDPRVLFDLAQTCFELGLGRDDQALLLNALEHYQHRADLEHGGAEEAYLAQHQVAVIAEHIGDWPLAIDAYMRAWELRPQRLESVQRLTTGLRERELYHAAHRFARMASRLRPLQMPEDSLSLAPWVYEWGLLFEYSITSYWIGEYQNSIGACRALLRVSSLSGAQRAETERNLERATREDRKQSERQRASRRRKIHATGSNTKPRLDDLSLGTRATDLVGRAIQQLHVSEAELQPLLRESEGAHELAAPGLGMITMRPGGRDLLTLVELLEDPAQLAPPGLGSADAITVLGAGSGIGALFLGLLFPSASVRVISADAADAELCMKNLGSLGERAVVQLDGEQAPPTGAIDLLRVEMGGESLLAAEPAWLDCASHAIMRPGDEGPGALLSELRLRGFDARIGSDGQVIAQRTASGEGA